MFRIFTSRVVPILLFTFFCLFGPITTGCGGEEECTKNGDCTKNPSYGTGYACIKKDGLRVCTKTCPSSCQKDAECAKCSSGKNYCVSGQCNYEPDQCPTSCSLDSDCKECYNGRTSCVGGACAVAPAICPSSCSADGDCKDCAAGNTFCHSGTCGPKTEPPACPGTCRVDSDCSKCESGNNFCVSGKCAQAQAKCPVSCTANSDCTPCSADQKECVNNKCGKKTTPTCPNSCTNDSDCTSCSADQKECVNNKCGKKTTPNCPSSCSNNNDCSACSADQKECVDGKCGTVSCPNSCTNDSDCAPCGADQKECVNNKCGKKTTPTCPATCTVDSDCSVCPTGKQTCVNGTCDAKPVCPGSCSKNTDCAACPTGQQSCVANKCGGAVACPSGCVVNSDCSKCSNGEIACVSGKCGKPTTCPSSCSLAAECVACGGHFECSQSKCQAKKPPLVGPGQTCSTTNRCRNGDVCIRVSGLSTCFQDCSAKASACAPNTKDGRTNCVPFAQDGSGNTISVCMGEAKKGQACGLSFEEQAECQKGLSPPLYCAANNTCKAGILRTKAGDTCNKVSDTSDPRKLCDQTKNLVCGETTGKCAVVSFAKEAEECDITGQSLGKIVLCDPKLKGLSCISFNSKEGISRCHQTCTPTASNQCKHRSGLTCEPLLSGGRGLCMDKTCTKDTDCVFTGYVCSPLKAGGNMCYPPIPSGPGVFAKVCGSPYRSKGCISSLFCLILSSGTNGFCSKDCAPAGSTCPKVGSIASSCATFTNGDKACVFPCRTTGQVCPPGLKCNASVGICSAP